MNNHSSWWFLSLSRYRNSNSNSNSHRWRLSPIDSFRTCGCMRSLPLFRSCYCCCISHSLSDPFSNMNKYGVLAQSSGSKHNFIGTILKLLLINSYIYNIWLQFFDSSSALPTSAFVASGLNRNRNIFKRLKLHNCIDQMADELKITLESDKLL